MRTYIFLYQIYWINTSVILFYNSLSTWTLKGVDIFLLQAILDKYSCDIGYYSFCTWTLKSTHLFLLQIYWLLIQPWTRFSIHSAVRRQRRRNTSKISARWHNVLIAVKCLRKGKTCFDIRKTYMQTLCAMFVTDCSLARQHLTNTRNKSTKRLWRYLVVRIVIKRLEEAIICQNTKRHARTEDPGLESSSWRNKWNPNEKAFNIMRI